LDLSGNKMVRCQCSPPLLSPSPLLSFSTLSPPFLTFPFLPSPLPSRW
jgi:hypothetical protein